jgi:hypothetical protein
MSAERGWIVEPQPARQWHDSHYSREADRIAARESRSANRTPFGRAKSRVARPDDAGSETPSATGEFPTWISSLHERGG